MRPRVAGVPINAVASVVLLLSIGVFVATRGAGDNNDTGSVVTVPTELSYSEPTGRPASDDAASASASRQAGSVDAEVAGVQATAEAFQLAPLPGAADTEADTPEPAVAPTPRSVAPTPRPTTPPPATPRDRNNRPDPTATARPTATSRPTASPSATSTVEPTTSVSPSPTVDATSTPDTTPTPTPRNTPPGRPTPTPTSGSTPPPTATSEPTPTSTSVPPTPTSTSVPPTPTAEDED